LKIAIICSYYPWPPSIGGVETIVRNVSTELVNRGHDVYVITSPFDVTSALQIAPYGIEQRDGVQVHRLKPAKFKIGYARFLTGLHEVLCNINPDVVHVHNMHPHLFQVIKWKDELNYKVIAELHHPVVELDHFSARIVFPVVINHLVHLSDKINVFIAHTDHEAQWLIKKGVSEHKVSKLRFPAVPSHLFDLPLTVPQNNGLVFVGRLTWRKGVHVLIKALSLISADVGNLKLTIIGPRNAEYAMQVERLININGLNDFVQIQGVISEQEKISLIAKNKLLVLPSLKDYTPNVLLEAQALGIPVVASNVGAVPELLLDGETGLLVTPDDSAKLAEALRSLLLNDELRTKMSLKAKDFSKTFALDRVVSNLEQVYA
jgi:glycosyltransferase involved in cell wall biosynthesis